MQASLGQTSESLLAVELFGSATSTRASNVEGDDGDEDYEDVDLTPVARRSAPASASASASTRGSVSSSALQRSAQAQQQESQPPARDPELVAAEAAEAAAAAAAAAAILSKPIRQVDRDTALRLFKKMDRNGDGTISLTELVFVARDTQSEEGRLLHELLGLPTAVHQEDGSKDEIVRLFATMHDASLAARSGGGHSGHDRDDMVGVTYDEWIDFMLGHQFLSSLKDVRVRRASTAASAAAAASAASFCRSYSAERIHCSLDPILKSGCDCALYQNTQSSILFVLAPL
jgi:hypothetical protein